MKYYKIAWKHNLKEEPSLILGEINDNLWEVRRIEFFQDGSFRYTDGYKKVGDIDLAENRMDEKLLNVDGESVRIIYISKSDFENEWNKAKKYASDNHIPERNYTKS